MSPAPLSPVFRVPTGVDRLGFPTYGRTPGGVPNPPNAWQEAQELQTVRILNARANQNPQAVQFTEWLDEHGNWDLWMDMAKQYRRTAGFVKGWVGTAMVAAAVGSAKIRTTRSKNGYDRMRPFQVDQSIRTIGAVPRNASYPSGHAASSAAAATVMSQLWPARAHEFNWWARQVALSRVHAGVHFPSDVAMGAAVGRQAGLAATSILY